MVRRSAEEGTLDSDAARFVDRTLRFSELTASEVMTPRGQVAMLEDTAPRCRSHQAGTLHRSLPIPLTKGDHDNIVGVVHVKKAVGVPRRFAKPSKPAPSQKTCYRSPKPCTWMRYSPSCARVPCSSPWSSTNTAEPPASQPSKTSSKKSSAKSPTNTTAAAPNAPYATANGDWVFSGLRRPDEINTLIPGLEIEESPEYETVGGFMMERLGRIPEVGDSVPVPGGTLRVDTLEGRRVDRIRFTPHLAHRNRPRREATHE